MICDKHTIWTGISVNSEHLMISFKECHFTTELLCYTIMYNPDIRVPDYCVITAFLRRKMAIVAGHKKQRFLGN